MLGMGIMALVVPWGRLAGVAAHTAGLMRAGLLRFRLETFGLWYPRLPYQAPWWRPNLRAVAYLLGRLPRYACWLCEMQATRTDGAVGWWATYLQPMAFAEWRTALERADRTGDVMRVIPG